MKRVYIGLIESFIILNQKFDDINEVLGKVKNIRNINNFMLSEGELEKKKKGCYRIQVFYF